MDDVSGVGAAIGEHDHHSREPRQTCRVPARDIAGCAGFRGARQSVVRDYWSLDCDAGNSTGTTSDDALAAGAVDSTVVVYTGDGVADRFARRVSARRSTGNHAVTDVVDVYEADLLSRVGVH